jgi:DNA sulfur modification protein DndC
MLSHHTGDDRYQLLKVFKNKLTALANNQARRSRVRRNGTVGTGPFLVPIREQLMADLKTLEEKTGWAFLSAEEERYIREDWEKDRLVHNISDCKQAMMWG